MFKDSDFDDLDDLVDEGMAFVQEKDAENQGKISADNTEAINTAGEGVSTAAQRTPPTTTTIFDDEDVTMVMAQTLIKMKEDKSKEKGVVIKDETKPVEKTRKKVQGDAQIERDAEIALRLQAELNEELRVERERQEEASKVAIADMFDEKQLAAERAKAIRNKPPTKTQLRNLMMTCLKNMGGYKHSQLKGKSYEEIQGLYEKQQKRIQDFTLIDLEKEAQKPAKRLKRIAGSYATHKSPKKPKVMKSVKDVTEEEAAEYEKEKEELRLSLKIISNDDNEVNYELLADGSSSYHRDTQAFLRRLDKQDLNDLYKLVHERFQDHPLEGHDLLLWGDLRMIFDPDEKDELWMNQLD
ncbi:hypothetical protein Tco_0842589 [Tanacetum coccineum]|uniref:Uncharacterized protein n=1 Tax=Tanacetum coccineum TaxID=301880 RepID=A0ABQ5B366_9ASTR